MKLLVTGSEGQLVRSLIERVAGRKDLEIVALGRPELDLGRPGTIAPALARVAPDAVINAAAYTAVDQAEDEPDLAMRINGEAPGVLARAAREAGAHLIQISTDYVFDGRGEGPYQPHSPVAPLGAYGRSKLAGEEAVREGTPDYLIVRTAWLYSPFGRNFLKTMVRLSAERNDVGVVADQHGNPTSALDLADGLLAVLERWRAEPRAGLGRTYHAAGKGTTSWYGFAERIFARCAERGVGSAAARPLRTEQYPTKAPRPANSALDSTQFAHDFGGLPDWRESSDGIVDRLSNLRPGA